jgi:hypothetical protein
VRAWAGIPRTVWQDALTAAEAPPDGAYHLGVDIDPFGRAASLVAVTEVPEGAPLIDVIAHGDGSAWVAEAVRRHAHLAATITVDDYGPGRDLLMTLDGEPGLNLRPVTTRDVAAACYAFEQAVGARTVLHRGDPHLDAAVGGSLRTPGRSWVYERRLDTVQTPSWLPCSRCGVTTTGPRSSPSRKFSRERYTVPRIAGPRTILAATGLAARTTSVGQVHTATDGRDILLNTPDGWEVDQPWLWWDGPAGGDGTGGPFGNPPPGAGGGWSGSGGYLAVPAFLQCTNLIAEQIAAMPWQVYGADGTRTDTPAWIADPHNARLDARSPGLDDPQVRLSSPRVLGAGAHLGAVVW